MDPFAFYKNSGGIGLVVAIASIFSTLTAAHAGEFLTQPEVKLGVLSHGAGFFSSGSNDGVDFNFEYQFESPRLLDFLGSPRPHLGASLTTSGDDVHRFYGGLSWNYLFADDFFVSGHAGAAIHTADNLREPASGDPNGRYLGCRVLFRLAAGLGYRISDHVDVELFMDHFSNANLCGSNDGLESMGIRLGYSY